MKTDDMDSAVHWFHAISGVPGIRTPRTVFVGYDHREAVLALEYDGKYEAPLAAIVAACEVVGYPCFLRTDKSSAKHNGPSDYRVNEAADVPHVFWATVEDNELKFWLEKDPPVAFMVREWLDLDASFTAFGMRDAGHPIAREWRVFARPSGVDCVHFYWPLDAVEQGDPKDPEWRTKLAAEDASLTPDLEAEIRACAMQAAQLCSGLSGAWSVDFAVDREGRAWLIDMARAERSWHPSHPGDPPRPPRPDMLELIAREPD